MRLTWLIVVAAIILIAVIIIAILQTRRSNEKIKYQRAAKNLIQEELLNHAIYHPGDKGIPGSKHVMVYLNINTNPVRRVVFDPSRDVIIGRDDSCQLCARDELISQRHCRIGLYKRTVYVQDLNSGNGTYVRRGARRIRIGTKPFSLQSGDRLLVGSLVIKVTPFIFDDAAA